MLLRALVLAGFTCIVSFTATPAKAAESPPPPNIEASFEPPIVEPSPCFEFACYDGADFDGDTLVAAGASYPAVYVFVRNRAGAWTSQAVLKDPDPNAPPINPLFGHPLGLSGNDLFVGFGGGVHVYRRWGTRWSYVQTLDADGAIAAQDGTVLIGSAKGVQVYERTRRGSYRIEATLVAPGASDPNFGASLAFDGNTAVVGAPSETGGAAYVFERLCSRWRFVQKLVREGAPATTGFASALDLDSGTIAIGEPRAANEVAERPGAVQLYVRRGWQWRVDQRITNPIPVDGEHRSFGTRVDLDGRRLLASGDVAYPYAAFVPMNYLYERGRNGWAAIATLNASEAARVRISGDSALVDKVGFRAGTVPLIFALPR